MEIYFEGGRDYGRIHDSTTDKYFSKYVSIIQESEILVT
jgi:hypothetical protein